MADTADPAELELARRAIVLGRSLGGCCEWQDRSARRVRSRPPVAGLTPEGIKELLCDFVADQDGEVKQVREKREEYQDQEFYYKVVLPLEGVPNGLFVELVLVDRDPEYPTVWIVNAH